MSTDLLEGRVAELEARAQRLVLAGDDRDGWGAWRNLLELRLMQQQDSERALLTEVIASLQREFEATAKRLIGEAQAQKIRGTYARSEIYAPGDVVALDGGSFMAKRSAPGLCPGPDWQLIARQGQRGIAGPQGIAGKDAPKIVGWVVDRAAFTVAPKLSDGSTGPLLELAELFQPSADSSVT
jgi:hypothetical protein